MRSYDGAKICELIGLLLLHNLSDLITKENTGLYRDDGLIVVRNMRGCTNDKLQKNIIKTFKSFRLQIEIATGLPSVDFLDVTLDLKSNTFRPYKKPNDSLLYVHTPSNHPPQILKLLPAAITERLLKNSSNKAVFDLFTADYQEALKKSGYEKFDLKNTTQALCTQN